MGVRSFTLNPSCTPDTWCLWVGPQRVGSVSIDSATGHIKQIGYFPFDPFSPQQLRTLADGAFGKNASILKINVAFRFDQWTWIPTAQCESANAVDKWIRPFFPERMGHSWVDDPRGPAEATAWVDVPAHLIDQLKKLSANIHNCHATGFLSAANSSAGPSLELVRVGNRCWFSLFDNQQFLYGQPHIIEELDDLLYVLGILFEKYGLQATDTRLSLVGEWEPDSDWLNILRLRFNRIEGRDAPIANLGADHPGHWFTPLADLLACV